MCDSSSSFDPDYTAGGSDAGYTAGSSNSSSGDSSPTSTTRPSSFICRSTAEPTHSPCNATPDVDHATRLHQTSTTSNTAAQDPATFLHDGDDHAFAVQIRKTHNSVSTKRKGCIYGYETSSDGSGQDAQGELSHFEESSASGSGTEPQ